MTVETRLNKLEASVAEQQAEMPKIGDEITVFNISGRALMFNGMSMDAPELENMVTDPETGRKMYPIIAKVIYDGRPITKPGGK